MTTYESTLHRIPRWDDVHEALTGSFAERRPIRSRTAAAFDFDPNEPRDPQGRWHASGGHGWGVDTSSWAGKIGASVKSFAGATRWLRTMKTNHSDDEDFLRFAQMAYDWQDYDEMDTMRRSVDHVLKGGRDYDGSLWLDVLANSGRTKKLLHRGFRIQNDDDPLLNQLQPGNEIDLPLSSFSEDDEIAYDYSTMLMASGGHPVVLHLTAGAQGIPVSNFTDDWAGYDIREVVTGGRFGIENVYDYDGTKFIDLSQRGVFTR